MSDNTSRSNQNYEVKGTVRLADGAPVAGIKVSAFDRDLRAEELLGQSRTKRDGSYLIQYDADAFSEAETGSVDLVVKAFGEDESLLAVSSVMFNAPTSAIVDVMIPAQVRQPPSLFEKIAQALKPLLDGLTVQELEEDAEHEDMSFLSGETAFDKTVLARFALAHRLAQQGLPVEFWFVLLGGSFFQYAEEESLTDQLSTLLSLLSSLDATAVHKLLISGFNQKEISEAFREKVDEWIAAFLRLVASQSVGAATKPTFVKSALEHAGITNTQKQEKFAGLFNEYRSVTPDLLQALERDRSFKKAEIADLRTSFQLAELTRGDFSVVKAIKEQFGVRQPEQIPTLATHSEEDWVLLIKAKDAAGELTLPIEVGDVTDRLKVPAAEIYGKTLAQQFRDAFPTTAFAGGLDRALQNGGTRGLRHGQALQRFLKRHQDFDLLKTSIDDYLKTHVVPADGSLLQNDGFRLELKAVQRVFKLAGRFEVTDVLLADNLRSGQQIYRLGQSEFVRRYAGKAGFTAEDARVVWNRAADTHAAVLTLIGDLKALEAEGLPAVLKNGNTAVSAFPNWNNLFKTGDLCECEHCCSMLSPAAYFADLLMYLRDRRSAKAGLTVKDVLLNRRPDLGYLELNCENALTPLPYIDVVCEVLEAAVDVAGENNLELAGFTLMPADATAAKAAVAQAMKNAFADPVNDGKQKIELGADFTLSQVNPLDPDQWIVHGDDITYLLKKKGTPDFFANILRNTKARAEELRAYPQYVNPQAYLTLRAAQHPLSLPFDLFAEEVRAAFTRCNLQRWELMQNFRGMAAPNNPSDGDIAAEYFGISADPTAAFDEKRLILVTDPTVGGQQTVWGEVGNVNWLATVTNASDPRLPNTLANVKKFLQKTGLEYDELLALLDLTFINPAHDLAILHLDVSCDTDKKVITNLNPTKLDRIHRFLRLWRKLKGWKMWELDLVVRHPGIGNGTLDEPFLIALFDFSEVRSRLDRKSTVEQVCALFGNLNIETRFTKQHEKREEAFYQNLFLNKRFINPLDPAFEVANVNVSGPTTETLSSHQSVVLAALGIGEADLIVLKELTKASNSTRYITDDLTLSNLSFLWRHAWLSKQLKLTITDWTVLLKLVHKDLPFFAVPKDAIRFLDISNSVKAAGFSPDTLNWILAADRSAKAAMKESDAARFLSGLRKQLQAIKAEYSQPVPSEIDGLTTLLTVLLQQLQRDQAGTQFFLATLRNDVRIDTVATGLPLGFDFPPAIKATIQIRYDKAKQTMSFTGLMSTAEKTALVALTGNAAYQAAIEDLFTRPRLALKFFEPVFTAPLASLPTTVNFHSLADRSLASRMLYDAEERMLGVTGILSKDDKAALDALSADTAYRTAVTSLAAQPGAIAPPDARIWLLDTDLQLPLQDNVEDNLMTAITKALTYLSNTLLAKAMVQNAATELGLTEALCQQLLNDYSILPQTLLIHLTGPSFVGTSGVVDYATLKPTFDAWFWASRVATVWKKWKLTFSDYEMLVTLPAGAQLVDFGTFPLDSTGTIASLEKFLRAARVLTTRDALPETGITFLEVLNKLGAGSYPTAAFAADVQFLNDAWLAADMQALTAALDLTYPGDYLLAESWDRLGRTFYYMANLNAGTDAVKAFAATTMTDVHAKTLKKLLRSKFGVDTWLALSADIQDALRERKRDSLAAYLLAQPMPADTPSGKWDNPNDLYAYYLLDVEMGSCQLTSRLVQASGSVQLFGQRCFMGLEPDVVVNADGPDGDSAWRWWKWMRKYRVWEANRKIFLWPENWIEPELKKDRSEFFKELENELLQNEINQNNVEKAFTNYLEKLDGVAQLEIAGFYQEDDADNTIIHVFGRTPGGEPHLYYYRRYDYRQWWPWEKVDLDIQGDYLVPVVVNNRLFLFWPVFTEVPDEDKNNESVPIPSTGATVAPLKPTHKRLRLQMAVSGYQQGIWTPKKVSKDSFESNVLRSYWFDIVRKFYRFVAVDRSTSDGRFVISFRGSSVARDGSFGWGELSGAFEITGCHGVPERSDLLGNFQPVIQPEWYSVGQHSQWLQSDTEFMKWLELGSPDDFVPPIYRHDFPQDDFTLENLFASMVQGPRYTPVLLQTPWFFRMSPPWQLSYFDRLLLDGWSTTGLSNRARSERIFEPPPPSAAPIGNWLPFFYNDKKRTFFVLPSMWQPPIEGSEGGSREYYPDIKTKFSEWEGYYGGQVQTWVDNFLPTLTSAQRQQLEQLLYQRFPEEVSPPYTDEQVKNLIKRFLMRYFHFYLGRESLKLFQNCQFHFKNFYHPFVCDFAKLLYNPLKGIPALMSRETQLKDSGFSFDQTYRPQNAVAKLPPEYPLVPDCYPREIVDFTPNGAYSPYNWELFFHAPLLIANSLSKNQRFEEARDWYHFIFNPIGMESSTPGGSAMSKYWITKPFFETTDPQYVQQRIENILRMLAGDTSAPGYSAQAKKDLEDQVFDWRTYPFDPHRIANYRTVAYQKTVVMKYLNNLIAWGDYLFRQDSMESINEATQLYIMAAEILGPRPKKIPPQSKPPVESFNELEQEFDKFSNALVEVENLVPQMSGNRPSGSDPAPLPMLYFCIPQNDKMLGYRDTIADRLFKIRHCMNIEGVVRQLALFEPPIEPGALVKAIAAGVDISSALADLNAPLPLYRFNVLLQKANEVCNDVKSLGSALLSALEKRDAEALGLLRQSQEIRLLEAVKAVREKQIEEAKENLEGTKNSGAVVETRRNYYRDIERLTSQEQLHLEKLSEAHGKQEIAQGITLGASIISLLPEIDLGASGFGGSPVAKFKIGGLELGQAARLASDVYSFLSQIALNDSTMASSKASFDRRWDDWKLQERLAEKELMQMDKQIAAAELRVAIAENELENHILQIENARAIDDSMRSKYTNQELYQWQVGQISGVYFQSYQLAYDLAKRAERCFRFELGLQDSNYVQFGYWDSLKKGLLAGEKLQYDLRRLETAYLEQNRRKFELTKSISLLLLDPLALVQLRETGRCFFSLSEEIFDLDYPGHYFRCIESVSITLPCVIGPYMTISCTLRLLKNSIRINTANADNGYPRNTDSEGVPTDDDRFIENNVPVKAIAISNGQNDSGVFELSFRDERYLPFEGAGVISDWSLELFNDPGDPDYGKPLRQFDYGTISDAILHVKYTAREDAGPFKKGVVLHLRDYFSPGDGATPSIRMFNLRQEFPSQWNRFLTPSNPADGNVFELEMSPHLFRILDKDKTLKVNTLWLLARCMDPGSYEVVMTPPLPPPPPDGSNKMTLTPAPKFGGLHTNAEAGMDVSGLMIQVVSTAPAINWQLKMTRPDGSNLQTREVSDLFLVLGYQWA
jgi:hypothetical protein